MPLKLSNRLTYSFQNISLTSMFSKKEHVQRKRGVFCDYWQFLPNISNKEEFYVIFGDFLTNIPINVTDNLPTIFLRKKMKFGHLPRIQYITVLLLMCVEVDASS